MSYHHKLCLYMRLGGVLFVVVCEVALQKRGSSLVKRQQFFANF